MFYLHTPQTECLCITETELRAAAKMAKNMKLLIAIAPESIRPIDRVLIEKGIASIEALLVRAGWHNDESN
jgi:hypothetical protein